DDWAQYGGPTRDLVWREDGIVETLPAELTRLWEAPVAQGYSGPAVADGKVFVTDYRRLDDGEIPDGERIDGVEGVRCFDAETGDALWSHEYPCDYEVSYPYGPRATPTIDSGKVYALGTMGDLHCLDATSGAVIWKKNYVADFGARVPRWGVAAAPLVDGDKLIVVVGGKPNAAVMALDKNTGDEVWRSLESDSAGYCPPIIIEAGGTRQLIAWLPNALSSLDPETGELHWSEPFEIRYAMSIATPIYDPSRRMLFVSAFYDGPLMMRLSADRPEAEVLWRGSSENEREPDGLHALMCTPQLVDGYLYGICTYGQLRCVDAETGEQQWETLEATGDGRWWNAFLIRHGDRYFIANEQGDLITAALSPDGYAESSRAHLIDPTNKAAGRDYVWSPPAFAGRRIYARNDNHLICADLAVGP
ncbi:MAG TPA: PQQ-binding-like beta-propeller repeat protein, partial [Armatimonadota bacterium]|nr:PQQ-binding-like beta-propeller repeat protein [Armatimonadota bacterium]